MVPNDVLSNGLGGRRADFRSPWFYKLNLLLRSWSFRTLMLTLT